MVGPSSLAFLRRSRLAEAFAFFCISRCIFSKVFRFLAMAVLLIVYPVAYSVGVLAYGGDVRLWVGARRDVQPWTTFEDGFADRTDGWNVFRRDVWLGAIPFAGGLPLAALSFQSAFRLPEVRRVR